MRRTHNVADCRYYSYRCQRRLSFIFVEVHFYESLVLACQVSCDLDSEWGNVILEYSHELVERLDKVFAFDFFDCLKIDLKYALKGWSEKILRGLVVKKSGKRHSCAESYWKLF